MSADDFAVPAASFWMVWRIGTTCSTVQHPTAKAAYAEANRLAALNPCARFIVLEAIGEVVGTIITTARTLGRLDVLGRSHGQLGDPPRWAEYDSPPAPAGGSYDYHAAEPAG